MIETNKLNKYYGSRHAVKDLTLVIEPGKTTGFLGGNGAGKSTTMRLLTGFLTPTSGSVKIAGYDMAREPLRARKLLGYLPESNPLYRDMRVREFLTYRAQLKDIARAQRQREIDRVIESCWLCEVERQIIGQLSKGYRQRVGLADGLLGDPPLLILDEPTVGLDPNQVRQTRSLIQEIGKERTVFLSTHILHEVELVCEQVMIIKHGEIVARGQTQAMCANYHGTRTLRLQINAPENPAEFLRNINTITNIEEQPAPNALAFRLQCTMDNRQEIARLASERGWLVEEMTLEPVKLEDIFSQLTT